VLPLILFSVSAHVPQSPDVVIFRAASRDFYDKPYFAPFIHNVNCYAKLHGYATRNCFAVNDTKSKYEFSAHYWRIQKAVALLRNPQFHNDTIFVYTDIDAAMRFNDTLTIPQLVKRISNIANQDCHLIFQDYTRNFNSGFFIFRRSAIVAEFLSEWWDSCERIEFENVWLKDQGPANNAVLRLLSRRKGVNYTDECIEAALAGGPSAAMACYNHWMTHKLAMPPLERFAHGICLPSNVSTNGGSFTTRFGVPVCESDYSFDRYLLHSKCAKAKAMMTQLHATC
jgi:hypothetical protein